MSAMLLLSSADVERLLTPEALHCRSMARACSHLVPNDVGDGQHSVDLVRPQDSDGLDAGSLHLLEQARERAEYALIVSASVVGGITVHGSDGRASAARPDAARHRSAACKLFTLKCTFPSSNGAPA
jgi:hypothetical protein